MTTPGLLVEDYNGQDYLLTTESHAGVNTHRLVVLRRINGQWQQVTGTEELARRELLISAFVDFFVNFCRVLNSSDLDRSPTITSASGRSGARSSTQTKHKRGR
ncbi:MAG: hypothetical protein AABY61_10565 [Nitrospirota bacterium]